MSWSTISASRSSGYDRKSPSRFRVNSTLPAPTRTIRVISALRASVADADDVPEAPGCGTAPPSPGWSGSCPRRRASAKARSATGGTAVSGAWSSSAAAGIGSRSAPSMERPRRHLDDAGAPGGGVGRDVHRRRPAGSVRRERDDHRLRVDDRRDARRHLPGLRALRVDDRHLLELQRGLERRGVARRRCRRRTGGRPRRARRRGPRRGVRPPRSRPPRGPRRAGSRAGWHPARSPPSSSASTSSVATRVAANVLVITGTRLGPPAERTTWSAVPSSVLPGTWTIATVGTRPRKRLDHGDDVAELAGRRDAQHGIAGTEALAGTSGTRPP